MVMAAIHAGFSGKNDMTPQELKDIRKRLKLTTAELGERLWVSGRTVEDWEQGRRTIRGPAEVLIRLLDVPRRKPAGGGDEK